jgi:predicted nucleic-acid-binding protein
MTGLKNNLTTVDANVLLRLFLNDELIQAKKATVWLARQPASTVLVTDSVLVEVLFQLESKRAYGIERANFMPRLGRALSATAWLLHPVTLEALRIFAATKLDYVDCLLAAMQASGDVSAVATFDKGLQKQLGEAALL